MKKKSPVTKKNIKYAVLTLDGVDYSLAFTFNSIAEAEASAGINLMQGIVGMTMGGLTAAQFRGLFFAALLPAQPDMTIADAGDLITLSNSPAIKDAIIEAYAASMPPAEDTKKSTAKSDPNE